MARFVVTLLLAFGVLGSSAFTVHAGTPTDQPNIVLILSDDQAWTDYGFMNHPEIRTPHLDRLAAEGTRFTHAFCTTASCSASRSVIPGSSSTATSEVHHLEPSRTGIRP